MRSSEEQQVSSETTRGVDGGKKGEAEAEESRGGEDNTWRAKRWLKVIATLALFWLSSPASVATTTTAALETTTTSPAGVEGLIVLTNGSLARVVALEDYLSGSQVQQQQQQQQQQRQQQASTLPSQAAAESAAEPERSRKKTSTGEEKTEREGGGGGQVNHLQQSFSSGDSTAAVKPIPQHWQVKSLLNVTHDYPLEYSRVICGYVWPLMAALTLFSNLMIVFVLTQRDMRTPPNVVLTAIAIADIIPIVAPVPWFVYLFALGNERQVLFPPLACYFYQHSTRSVSEVFYFLSTWLNVLLAVQDYLNACRPNAARRYCRIRVVVVEIVVLTLLAFMLNLPQALKIRFKPVKFYYLGEVTWGCKAMQAKWFKDIVGDHVAFYDDVFTAIIVLLVDGGPAIALITLTSLLIRQLHQQRIKGHMLMEQARTASKRRRERERQMEYESSARVMIFVLLAFLAVKIPFATTYTLMIIQSRFDVRFVENLVDFQKAITLTDLVFVLSYPLNFTIFCCCSKKFRHKCVELLGEWSGKRDARGRRRPELSHLDSLDSTTSADDQRQSLAIETDGCHLQSSAADRRSPVVAIRIQREATMDEDGEEEKDVEHADQGELDDDDAPGDARWSSQRPAEAEAPGDRAELTLDPRRFLVGADLAASSDLWRLLQSGSLCLECIERYEQLRNSCTCALPTSAAATTATTATTTTTTDTATYTAATVTRRPSQQRVPRVADASSPIAPDSRSLNWPPAPPVIHPVFLSRSGSLVVPQATASVHQPPAAHRRHRRHTQPLHLGVAPAAAADRRSSLECSGGLLSLDGSGRRSRSLLRPRELRVDWADPRRSLSLSHSKLTALPTATFYLADAMISALGLSADALTRRPTSDSLIGGDSLALTSRQHATARVERFQR